MLDHSAFEGFYVIQWLFVEVWVQVSCIILAIVTKKKKKAFIFKMNAVMAGT